MRHRMTQAFAAADSRGSRSVPVLKVWPIQSPALRHSICGLWSSAADIYVEGAKLAEITPTAHTNLHSFL